jgi:ornithine--oxo-acid transaminase
MLAEEVVGAMNSKALIDLTEQFSAHNYAPLEVVLRSGDGAWVEDVDGKRYLDFLAAYSALNFGHRNPRLLKAAHQQLETLTLTSRAFFSEAFALACKDLSLLCAKDKVLFMNSGAEAVETAVKAVRKWGYEVKGIPHDRAEIVVCRDNFHGRTTTIVGFSTSEESRTGFGPFASGFRVVDHGDAVALEDAITENTAGVIFEPIQGEAGIIIPPRGYLAAVREICSRRNVLMVADEIQSGLCRTGKLFACDHENVRPDMYILAKSLGGGIVPVSAIAADDEIMKVFTPGTHGSTFGGNPLACAIVREVVALIREEKPEDRSAELGAYGIERLKAMQLGVVTEIRGSGLWFGIDIDPAAGKAKDFCKKLKYDGVLCKDTRQQTIRIAPPLTISKADLDLGLEKIAAVLG